MDGGVIAAQEEAHKQAMMQQVLSPIFLKLYVALGANILNFGGSSYQIFGIKSCKLVPTTGEAYLLQSQFVKRKKIALSSLKCKIETFYPTPLKEGGGGPVSWDKIPTFQNPPLNGMDN